MIEGEIDARYQSAVGGERQDCHDRKIIGRHGDGVRRGYGDYISKRHDSGS